MPELLLCCALLCSNSRLLWALLCCHLLLQLCLLLKHLRSSAFSLSLLGFVSFVFFPLRCQLFFVLAFHLFFFINSCAFSYYLSFLLPDEACGQNVVNSTVSCYSAFFVNYYTSILFVLHKCLNFFSVEHFCAAIVVFSARFGAAFCYFNFAFCWTT